MHEREEMAQRRDAKVHKDRERRRRRHLMEEGSENEDEGFSEEEHIDEDDVEEEDGGTQVGHPNISSHYTDRLSHSV